ncbi:hypothetical protein ABT083_36555 [Streptomyces goshikiensis]|uniref:hypothetical protein n=1 Tax=Streptomyces goshikiensis TaxID=1942 RepID=UPI00331B8C54
MMNLAVEAGDWGTWSASFVAIAALLYSLYQGWQQRRDQLRANELQAEASQLQQREVEAAERRALAMEETLARLVARAELAADVVSIPGSEAQGLVPAEAESRHELGSTWAVERRGKHGYVLRNVSDRSLTGVHVNTSNLPPVTRNVPEGAVVRAGESIQFLMAPAWGGPVPDEIWVSWDGQDQEVAVRLPT